MSVLQLPEGENLILAAFASLSNAQAQAVNPNDIIHQYESHFITSVDPGQPGHRNNRIERFSLVDPTIQTVIKSSTSLA